MGKQKVGCGGLICLIICIVWVYSRFTGMFSTEPKPTPAPRPTTYVTPAPTPDYDTILAIQCAKDIIRNNTSAEIQFEESWRRYDVLKDSAGAYTVTAVSRMRYTGGSWFNRGWTTTFTVKQVGNTYEWELINLDWGE